MLSPVKKILRHFFPRPEVALLNRLRKFRTCAERVEFELPGGTKIEGMKGLEAYNEYKDLFINRIYDFHPRSDSPRIIDGGAYVGFSTIRFKRIWPRARVSCFECDPRNLNYLRKNLQNAKLDDVEILELALSGSEGKRQFCSTGDDGGALVDGERGESGFEVNCVRLSDWLNEPVDLLKLNVEGAEIEILEEAAGKLDRVREIILEYHDFPGQEQRLNRLLSVLKEAGFRCLFNHFDYESNLSARPPFEFKKGAFFIMLVYAANLREFPEAGS